MQTSLTLPSLPVLVPPAYPATVLIRSRKLEKTSTNKHAAHVLQCFVTIYTLVLRSAIHLPAVKLFPSRPSSAFSATVISCCLRFQCAGVSGCGQCVPLDIKLSCRSVRAPSRDRCCQTDLNVPKTSCTDIDLDVVRRRQTGLCSCGFTCCLEIEKKHGEDRARSSSYAYLTSLEAQAYEKFTT